MNTKDLDRLIGHTLRMPTAYSSKKTLAELTYSKIAMDSEHSFKRARFERRLLEGVPHCAQSEKDLLIWLSAVQFLRNQITREVENYFQNEERRDLAENMLLLPTDAGMYADKLLERLDPTVMQLALVSDVEFEMSSFEMMFTPSYKKLRKVSAAIAAALRPSVEKTTTDDFI